MGEINLTEISQISWLENTRLLYTGIKELHDSFLQIQSDAEPMENVKKRAEESSIKLYCGMQQHVGTKWNQCMGDMSHDNQAYQNSLHTFFAFLYDEFKERAQMINQSQGGKSISPEELSKNCQEHIVRMLQLYHTVEHLRICNHKKEYPALFEELCNCILQALSSGKMSNRSEEASVQQSMCYLLYAQRDQITLLSTSDYPAAEENGFDSFSMLNRRDFDALRIEIEATRHDKNEGKGQGLFADTILRKSSINKGKIQAYVFNFPKYPYEKWKDEWFYLVYQAYDKKGAIEDDLIYNSRSMLFLRQHIFEQVQEKMHILLMAQRSFQYICPLSQDAKMHFLHLTDLHLTKEKEGMLDELPEEILKDSSNMPIDLIFVTGDVIQGQRSAGNLEDNYEAAKRFLQRLAYKVWATTYGYVRADWRKRIVIVPGNHDYAAMNELEAVAARNTNRVTGSGIPALHEGGPMTKFTYYIDFMRQLLDLDIGELIDNDLNEYRCYSQLDIGVLAINTVSKTEPLRNNKVGINDDKVEVLQQSMEQTSRLFVLGHHIPCYSINYPADRYYMPECGIQYEDQEKWISTFCTIMTELHSDAEKCQKAQQELANLIRDIEKFAEELPGNKKEYINGQFYQDIVRIQNELKRKNCYSDQVAELANDLYTDTKMSDLDNRRLKNSYNKLLKRCEEKCGRNVDYFFAGHTHKLKEYQDITENFQQQMKIPGVEGGKACESDTYKKFYWNILEVDSSGVNLQTKETIL